jgi:phosphohistidine phosphatase
MPRLLLIRHAKSSWDDPALTDIARPLNPRGRKGATRLGRWLATEGIRPDHALISPAVRTQETWSRILAELGPVPTTTLPDLYEASPERMLAALRAAPPVATLAMIGHQPGIGAFASRLLAAPPEDADFDRYPTAATAVIDLDGDGWAEAGWGQGNLSRFVTPRLLEEA